MNRRSFLFRMGSAGLSAGVSSGVTPFETGAPITPSTFRGLFDSEEKLVQLAEHVVPGTDPNELTISQSDLDTTAPKYESTQPELLVSSVVNRLADAYADLSVGDIAASSHLLTDEVKGSSVRPRTIDRVAIAIPSTNPNSIVSEITDWEDTYRSEHGGIASTGSFTHNDGFSRWATFSDPSGYRIQRIRSIDDRLLITWVEGIDSNNESCLPLVVGQQIEKGTLLRQARTYVAEKVRAGGPPELEPPRWPST